MSSYLLNRNGHYHFRIRIPSDLSSAIPAAELVRIRWQLAEIAVVAFLGPHISTT